MQQSQVEVDDADDEGESDIERTVPATTSKYFHHFEHAGMAKLADHTMVTPKRSSSSHS